MKRLLLILACIGLYVTIHSCSPEPLKDSQESLQEQGCCGNEGDIPPPPPGGD